jgi:hemerythrin
VEDTLTWRDAWLIGIDPLDEEHRAMVNMINRLGDPEASETLAERLDVLIAHLRRHFKAEEVFLRAIEYPGMVAHCREHAMQMAEFVDLRRQLPAGRTSLTEAERSEIRTWFLNHVVAEDRRFAEYYRDVVCARPHSP